MPTDTLSKQFNSTAISNNLQLILDTSEKLRQLKATDIKFSDPIIKQNCNAVIFPHTINVIQGQAGVHKSRLAELFCASLLKKDDCRIEHLGLARTTIGENYTVVYVDTERNLKEQLPYALQSIQLKAGYKKADDPSNFKYVSLLEIPRKERFSTLDEYLNDLRKTCSNPLFIVLDVSTDCIEDFNKTDKSMELIDLMNMAINQHDVIFLCIIHENPKSDKARGHFGTELMNKASTVMQVGFEKDANQNDTDIIRAKYLKCRSTARHTPFFFKYSKDANGLVLADVGELTAIANSRKSKAAAADMIEIIEMYLGDGSTMQRGDFLEKLRKDFSASLRTIESRISDILKNEMEILNSSGEICVLSKEIINKVAYYKLIPRKTQ